VTDFRPSHAHPSRRSPHCTLLRPLLSLLEVLRQKLVERTCCSRRRWKGRWSRSRGFERRTLREEEDLARDCARAKAE
jgi:hypothetical protein